MYLNDENCDRTPHGSFTYRLPPSALGTDVIEGYSLWHLLAARLIDHELAEDFLYRTADINSSALIDDIREHMSIFPDAFREHWEATKLNQSDKYRNINDWHRFVCVTAWTNPLQICEIFGHSLIWPLTLERSSIHPVVIAADVFVRERISTTSFGGNRNV